MKNLKKIIIIIILLIIFIYVCNITLLPESYILIQGEGLELKTILGLALETKKTGTGTLQASSNITKQKIQSLGKTDLSLKLFNLFHVRDVTVNVIPKTKVVPIGTSIGMKLYTDGVLVVGMSEIEGKKPYEHTGIKQGDRIIEIDNNQINNTNELMKAVNSSNGNEMAIKYVREEETITTSMKAVKVSNEEYKIGLWVRDAAAGVGTLTFYEPSTNGFATLRSWNSRY